MAVQLECAEKRVGPFVESSRTGEEGAARSQGLEEVAIEGAEVFVAQKLAKASAGDEVVTDPYSAVSKTLKDGMKVKVVPKDKLFEK